MQALKGYPQVTLNRKSKLVHQLVAMAFLSHVQCGHKLVVDHEDEVKTNNKLSNLKIDTNRGNLSRRGGSSEYVGVYWYKASEKWASKIGVGGKQIHLGYFTNEIDAHNAYQKKLKEII